jgi:arginyl-tRNA synthetase
MANLERLKGSADDDALVESIAYGAIKYGYLHYEPQTRIYFDIEQTISLEGNTGPYIQYAHARIKSIFEKAGEAAAPKIENLAGAPELNLMRLLNRYENAITTAASEYKPNLLCNYLHDLAGTFNGFYNDVPIIKESDPGIRTQRLALLEATANVLSHGLSLLGILAPERM